MGQKAPPPSRRSNGLTRAQITELYKRAGIEPPKLPPKYGNRWTYYNGKILHTTGSGCAPLPPTRCPICTNQAIKLDRVHWYQSRSEARFAAKLDAWLAEGKILRWRRSSAIVLSPAKRREDRVQYKPDFDVWDDPAGSWQVPFSDNPKPDRRYEAKGALEMVSQQGWVRIKLYRAAVERGEQPPLVLVNGDGRVLTR